MLQEEPPTEKRPCPNDPPQTMPAPNAPTTSPNGGRQQTKEQEKQTIAPQHPIQHHRPTDEKDTAQLTTRTRPRGRQPAMGRGMPSLRPKRPQNCRTDAKRPAAYTAPTKGLGDAKPQPCRPQERTAATRMPSTHPK